jgi:hypothetical protein
VTRGERSPFGLAVLGLAVVAGLGF